MKNESLLVVTMFSAVTCALGACGDESFSDAEKPAPTNEPAPDATPAVVAEDAGGEASVITGAPPGCDGTLLPTADPCVITEGVGVFVSATKKGVPNGDGTRAKPYQSLQQGIDAAKSTNKRVYVCAETYGESLVLADGVSIFGYFDCAAEWKVATGTRAKVEAKTSIAVKANGLQSPVRIEALEIVAPAGTAQDPSSIGVLAANVKSLRFVSTIIRASNGADGANGVDGTQLANASPASTLDGENNVKASYCSGFFCETVHGGGVGGTNTCVGAAGFAGGTGGHGGYGGHFLRSGSWSIVKATEFGGHGLPVSQVEPFGNGGTPAGAALPGASGEKGADGASAPFEGAIAETGFKPRDGTAGENGAPGAGGGGGTGIGADPNAFMSSGDVYGTSGAGGGAGGCPGLAGTAGRGGGASIGVISWVSALSFESSVVQAGNGGAGGKGTFGSLPTKGGKGGVNDVGTSTFSAGGEGLFGGHAGWSGHGAGGPSFGIAWAGPTKPDLGGMQPTVGSGGAGQAQVQGTFQSLTKTIPASPAGSQIAFYNAN